MAKGNKTTADGTTTTAIPVAILHWLFGPHFFDVGAILCIGIGVAMALSSDPKDVSAALWFFAIAALLAFGRAGHWIATTDSLPLPKAAMAFLLAGAIGACWYIAHSWTQSKLAVLPWLEVEVRSAIVSDSGPRTMYMVRYPSAFGDTLSPIIYLAYLRIVNNSDSPKSIDSMEFEVSKEPDGQWEELSSIPLTDMSLVTITDQAPPTSRTLDFGRGTFRLATQPVGDSGFLTALVPNLMEVSIRQPIAPHTPKYGWVALDSLRHASLAPGQIFLRVKVREGSRESSAITEFPRPIDRFSMETNCGYIVITNQRTDLTASHVKYWSDPFTTLPQK